MKIAVTGKITEQGRHVTREQLLARFEAMGHVAHRTIRPDTKVLVVGDTGRHRFTRKMKNALSEGVEVITLERLMHRLG